MSERDDDEAVFDTARRGPTTHRVMNLDGEQVAEAVEFSNGEVAVAWPDYAEGALPDTYGSLEQAHEATVGVVFEPLMPHEQGDAVRGGAIVRWELPANPEDATTLYRHESVIHAVVEAALTADPAFDVPEDVFETCDVLRVSAYRVGIMPTGPLAETALPESVEVVEPIADGGRSFSTQPETCPECGLTLDANGECKTNGCPGPE